jgi:hypothetical protein
MKFKKAITIVFHSLVVVAFFVALVIAIIITNGYQLDFFSRNFTKTSIIDLSFEVPDAQVFLDGKLMAGAPPLKIFNVFPGEHRLEVVKDGFLTWKYKVNVQADFVAILRNHLLFPDLNKSEWTKVADLETGNYRWIDDTLIKKTALGALEFYSLNNGQLILDASFESEGGNLEEINLIGGKFFYENDSEVRIYNLNNQSISVLQKDFSMISYLDGYWLVEGQDYLWVYDSQMDNALNKFDFNQTIENVTLQQKGAITFLKVKLIDEQFSQLLVLRGSELKMLAENLEGEVIVSEENKILLIDDGKLVLFDALYNKLVLARFNQNLDLLEWAAEGYFIFSQDGRLYLSDLDFENAQIIANESGNVFSLEMADKQLYRVLNNELGQEISVTQW